MQQERPGRHGWFEQESAGKPYPIRGIAVSPSQQLRNGGDAGDVEEAGVVGQIDKQPIGSFSHEKLLKKGETIVCDVQVFALEVTHQRKTWREKGKRSVQWFSRAEAARTVREPVLRDIIRKVGKRS
jgi:hypothetical protein